MVNITGWCQHHNWVFWLVPTPLAALCALLQVHDDLGIAESLETLGLIWHSREPSTAAQLLGAGPGWTKHNGPCNGAGASRRA